MAALITNTWTQTVSFANFNQCGLVDIHSVSYGFTMKYQVLPFCKKILEPLRNAFGMHSLAEYVRVSTGKRHSQLEHLAISNSFAQKKKQMGNLCLLKQVVVI